MGNPTLGYFACLVAVFFFGTNFVPVKRVAIGDGVFFQFIMCNAIFMTSLPVHAIQKFPPFHNLAMLGGFLWCSGNMMCGPVINLIGLSMGLLIWGSTGMVCGWASGTFGLFGLDKDEVKNEALNYAGITVAIVGLIVYLQVESDASGAKKSLDAEQNEGIGETLLGASKVDQKHREISVESTGISMPRDVLAAQDGDVFGSSWPPLQKRIVGIAMAVTAGALFGTSFNPAQYTNDHKYDGEDNGLNYVFPHFCGILCASWMYTVLYFAMKKIERKEPFVNPDCIVPATLSGLMWGAAEIAWFVANGELGFSVSFPIISSGPGFLGALWGIFLFKEITGSRNFTILGVAFCISVCALIMIALAH